MKNIWENVKNDNTLEIGIEKIPSKTELLKSFENSIDLGGWKFLRWINSKKAPYQCIINNGDNDIDIVIYLKSISNAGWENRPYSKRVQVTNPQLIDFKIVRRQTVTKVNLIIGYYNYEKPLFAAWSADEYTRHNTNRSCYVNVENIVEGYNEGYLETECRSQKLVVFKPEFMIRYINNYTSCMNYSKYSLHGLIETATWLCDALYEYNDKMNFYWDGKEKVKEMKDEESKNWRQMEWPGFYLEHMIENILVEKAMYQDLEMFGVGNEHMKFDLFKDIPWDLKVHSVNASSKEIPTNDLAAINYAVEEFGRVGFIVLEGQSDWDNSGEFKEWHDDFKGKRSKYVIEGEGKNRKSRRRKKGFRLTGIKAVIMDSEDVGNQTTFQQGMVNSNGNLRNEKMLLSLDKVQQSSIIYNKKINSKTAS